MTDVSYVIVHKRDEDIRLSLKSILVLKKEFKNHLKYYLM